MYSIIKYSFILSCFLFCLLKNRPLQNRPQMRFVICALFFTACADYFLIFTNYFLTGILLFCLVQLCYRLFLGGNWNSLLKNSLFALLFLLTGIFFRNHSAACCHLHRVSICQHLTCQTPEKFQPAYGAYAYVPLRYSCRFCQSSPIFESASGRLVLILVKYSLVLLPAVPIYDFTANGGESPAALIVLALYLFLNNRFFRYSGFLQKLLVFLKFLRRNRNLSLRLNLGKRFLANRSNAGSLLHIDSL